MPTNYVELLKVLAVSSDSDLKGFASDPSALWHMLFRDQTGFLAIFSGVRQDSRSRLEDPKQHFFSYPAEVDRAKHLALTMAAAGREVYHCAHLLTDRRRIKENAAPLMALYCDDDGKAHLLPDLPEPSVIVASSETGRHLYWLLDQPVAAPQVADLNHRLTDTINADPSGWDLTQLLRTPGTRNFKYADPYSVVVIGGSGRAHSFADLDLLIPRGTSPEPERRPGRQRIKKSEQTVNTQAAPPVRLDERGLEIWNGEKVRSAADGSIDRSTSLLLIGRVLIDAGATRQTIVEALRERDLSLGWCKYVERPDADRQYDAIVDELEQSGVTLRDSHRPTICVDGRHLHEIADDAVDALERVNTPPFLFVYGGRLARLRESPTTGEPLVFVHEDSMTGILSRSADFVKKVHGGHAPSDPPRRVVRDILASAEWPFPVLDGIIECPSLRADGTVIHQPGYDLASRLLYRPPSYAHILQIPDTPSAEDVRASRDLLEELLIDFPFVDHASKANALALLLTTVLRPAITGSIPMALIDKPSPGTGASLLVDIISLIATGRNASMMAETSSEEEWRKRITSILRNGPTHIVIDNVTLRLESSTLSAVLTSQVWFDRLLGQSQTITLPHRAIWIATGNNIRLGGDLPRRCYRLRLDAQASQPWLRSGFRHSDLRAWVREHRDGLITALLTIARAWFASAQPAAATQVLGGFESWSRTVGGVLAHAGFEGFLSDLSSVYEYMDEGSAEWDTFLRRWRDVFGDERVKVATLIDRLLHDDVFRLAAPQEIGAALLHGTDGGARSIGRTLSQKRDVRFGVDGIHLRQAGTAQRSQLWRVTTE